MKAQNEIIKSEKNALVECLRKMEKDNQELKNEK